MQQKYEIIKYYLYFSNGYLKSLNSIFGIIYFKKHYTNDARSLQHEPSSCVRLVSATPRIRSQLTSTRLWLVLQTSHPSGIALISHLLHNIQSFHAVQRNFSSTQIWHENSFFAATRRMRRMVYFRQTRRRKLGSR